MAFPADIQSGQGLLVDELITGLGYAWQTWAPSYSASGSMTYTSVSTTFARYRLIGASCHIEIKALGTTGGSASSQIRFTAPSGGTPANGGISTGCMAIENTSDEQAGTCEWDSGTSTFRVRLRDEGNWALAAGSGFSVSFFYEV